MVSQAQLILLPDVWARFSSQGFSDYCALSEAMIRSVWVQSGWARGSLVLGWMEDEERWKNSILLESSDMKRGFFSMARR